jgi:O-antigen ligase
LKQSLKWLFVGFSVAAIIGVIQIIATQTSLLNYGKLHTILEYLFTQTFHSRRIAGLAFEPSWFADQLVILYFPWIFSAILFNRSLSGKKWLDWIGILLLVGLLIFTYSRSGILNLGISVLITLLFTVRIWWQPLRKSIRSFFSTHSSRLTKYLKAAGLAVLIIAILLVFYFAMSSYSYFINIFNFEEEQSLFEYIVDISFGPRAGYAISAYEVFEENPILGVGLGASGLHMYDHFPDWLKTFTLEVEHFFDPNYSVIPNPKNLYIKLLSETGLIGFWLFISFQIAVLGQTLKLIKNTDQYIQMVGFAGILFWFLISIRFLTMDSFASPVVWINMGIFIGMSNYIAFKKDKTSS